jgi:hypothetical protein
MFTALGTLTRLIKEDKIIVPMAIAIHTLMIFLAVPDRLAK